MATTNGPEFALGCLKEIGERQEQILCIATALLDHLGEPDSDEVDLTAYRLIQVIHDLAEQAGPDNLLRKELETLQAA